VLHKGSAVASVGAYSVDRRQIPEHQIPSNEIDPRDRPTR
jgi:hypothetical protein